MELIDQRTKKIMEGCKERARDVGLQFQDETLEYVVTNRDLLELSPKIMIPTLYDYWVHDVEVLKEKGKYELYPVNPYETVINTRPAISFYNDNNPDWLNVMIFYHVLAHIDFFQNNLYFRNTWDYDFTGQALSDKRLIARLRAEKGRWVDYMIEFTRGIDNQVSYFSELSQQYCPETLRSGKRVDFYFDVFLQTIKKLKITNYLKEITRYNQCLKKFGELGEQTFFADVRKKYPEFEAIYDKNKKKKNPPRTDLIQYLLENSEFLNNEQNKWMKSVMQVVRKTALFFQPQIRTKILNEGWASYWHEVLFLEDDRIKGHEVDFARVNSTVTSLSRVGLNPYALGLRLFTDIEEKANKGKFSREFQQLADANQRKNYDAKTARGREFIFKIRENYSDFMFINSFVDQDFVNRYNLFVAGKRLNQSRMVWEYYVKSRKAEDYQQMLLDTLYHPPFIEIEPEKTTRERIYLNHRFEGKPLVKEFIENTMRGLEFLWGASVKLETSEIAGNQATGGISRPLPVQSSFGNHNSKPTEIKWLRVVYTMQKQKLSRILV